jgi:hypothetical protein
VAAEPDGRVCLAHAEPTVRPRSSASPTARVAADARVVTDGLASCDGDSLGERPLREVVQTKAQRRESDALPGLPLGDLAPRSAGSISQWFRTVRMKRSNLAGTNAYTSAL